MFKLVLKLLVIVELLSLSKRATQLQIQQIRNLIPLQVNPVYFLM